MYLLSFILVLGITFAMCLVVAMIKMIIAEVGLTFFITFLLIVACVFLFATEAGKEEEDGE